MQKSGTVTKSLRIGKTLTKGTGEEGPLGRENEKQSGFFCAETKGNLGFEVQQDESSQGKPMFLRPLRKQSLGPKLEGLKPSLMLLHRYTRAWGHVIPQNSNE